MTGWTPAQVTHAATTLASLVIIAVLAAMHIITPVAGIAALGIVTGTSLGIGANPPTSRT